MYLKKHKFINNNKLRSLNIQIYLFYISYILLELELWLKISFPNQIIKQGNEAIFMNKLS